MSQDSNFVAKLLVRWLLTWVVLLGWWWGAWVLFNQSRIVEGLVLGIGGPVLATLFAVVGFVRQRSSEGNHG
jgi:hypothetical protein